MNRAFRVSSFEFRVQNANTKHETRNTKRLLGFTLVELLAVVAIISVLAAIALPQYAKTIERGRWQATRDLLQTIYAGEQVHQSLDTAQHYIDPITETCAPLDATLPGWGCVYMDTPDPTVPVTFTFAIVDPPNPGFTVTATRNAGGPCGAWTRTIDQTRGGTWNDAPPC